MPDWLLYWVWPWALLNRKPKPPEANPLQAENEALLVEVRERDYALSTNLASVVLAAGNSVFVSAEVIDFVANSSFCALNFSNVPGGINVSVVFQEQESTS